MVGAKVLCCVGVLGVTGGWGGGELGTERGVCRGKGGIAVCLGCFAFLVVFVVGSDGSVAGDAGGGGGCDYSTSGVGGVHAGGFGSVSHGGGGGNGDVSIEVGGDGVGVGGDADKTCHSSTFPFVRPYIFFSFLRAANRIIGNHHHHHHHRQPIPNPPQDSGWILDARSSFPPPPPPKK